MEQQRFLLMRISKRFIAILLLSVLHFSATFALLFAVSSHSMSSFDTGAPPTFFDRAAFYTVEVLWFPVMQISWFFGFHAIGNGYPVLIANSVLWGIGLSYGFTFIGGRIPRRFSIKTALIVLTVVAVGLAVLYQLR
jgi:hypothetical protein